MKKLKDYANGIILCLFELIVGILLLINPVSFTSWIIMLVGIVLIAIGLFDVIKYFRTNAKAAAFSQTLVKGILSILAGCFCVFKTDWFIVTFPVITIIYGISVLVIGIGKLQLTVDMLRLKNNKWFWAAINAVVSIVCAIVILNNPFASTAVLWMFTGVSLIVEGVLDIITMLIGKKSDEATNA